MLKSLNSKENSTKGPPSRSKGFLTDVRYFFIHTPEFPTLVKFKSKEEKHSYSERIMQRLNVEVNTFGILNVHKIGVDVPAKYIFEELLKWNGDSTCWPNYIAKVDRKDNHLENIRILLFGKSKYPFGLQKSFFGLSFIPLFNLTSIRFQKVPDAFNSDNERYLLYKCSGGYPVGIFSMYVRSSLSEEQEKEQSQLFLMVGFNFYGHDSWIRRNLINFFWEFVHNRVTANILNRVKQLSEWRFEKIIKELA